MDVDGLLKVGKGGVMGAKGKEEGGMVGVRPGGTRQGQEL